MLLLAASMVLARGAAAQTGPAPERVAVTSGPTALGAWLFRPEGRGPFPAVLFNHGSYGAADPLPPGDAAALGAVFARHGYVFLFLCRQGVGLSVAQGTSVGDRMARVAAQQGEEARNRLQMDLLETEELDAARAGLAYVRSLPGVDPSRVGAAGHSFGGSLTLLLAAREASVRAAIVFAGGAYSWDRSPLLRARLREAVGSTAAPVLFVHAENDYSTAPGRELADRMRELGKPHVLKIYPPVGRSPRDGHNLVYRSASTWEADVFEFLGASLRR